MFNMYDLGESRHVAKTDYDSDYETSEEAILNALKIQEEYEAILRRM